MSETEESQELAHVGTCAIVGLPNAGKSTLLNKLLQLRLMAVSKKPQTTRHQVRGVLPAQGPKGPSQVVFVDTPGMQSGKGALRKFMRDETLDALAAADSVLLMLDVSRKDQKNWDALSKGPLGLVLRALSESSKPKVLALNKVDKVPDKAELFPILEEMHGTGLFAHTIPISAQRGSGLNDLAEAISSTFGPGPALFPEDMFTDKNERFLAAELIREQLFRQLGEELPYTSAVVIETFRDRPQGDVVIEAAIHVERDSQKGIVIGKGGRRIRELGEKGRLAVGELLGRPVHLKLFVKVNERWSESDKGLRDVGYKS